MRTGGLTCPCLKALSRRRDRRGGRARALVFFLNHLGYNESIGPPDDFACGRRLRGMMKTSLMTEKKQQPTFEEALSELEAIVENMEKGALPLEEGVQAFTRGTELVGFCNAKLQAAEQQIKKLEADGSLSDLTVSGMQPGEAL